MGGDFNLKHFLDPVGLTFGKGEGGGTKNLWDPLSVFTSGAKKSATADAPAPTVTPPATVASSEVIAAKRKTRTDAAQRKGYLASLIAGDTGGYKSPTGGKSLLGGG